MAFVGSLLVVVLFLGNIYSCLSDNFPVLVWSSEEKIVDSVRAKARWTNSHMVLTQVDSVISEVDTVVLYRDSGVSFSDIAKYGGAYGEEPSIMKNMKSLAGEFPFLTVESTVAPYDIAKKALQLKGFETKSSSPLEDCKGLKGTAFLVDLPAATSASESLAHADEVVGRTVRTIDECSVSFVVLYMSGVDGLEKNEKDKKESLPSYLSRHLTQFDAEEDDNITTVFIATNTTDCPMLYYESMTYTIPDDNVTYNVSRKEIDVNSIELGCDTINGSLKFIAFSLTAAPKIDRIRLSFPPYVKDNITDSFFWTVQIVIWDRTNENFTLTSTNSSLYATQGSSYHCSLDTVWSSSPGNITESYTFYIKGLQVQFGGDKTPLLEFANAYDCVPYFSAPIWMGIISLIPMVIVLYCSLLFIFSMDTPDRFDSPGGKPLQIDAK